MYLRTTRRKNRTGKVVEYYQLAHNERNPETRQPVAKVIHNFGRADEVDRQQLVRLVSSIARVCNLNIIDPLAEPEQARLLLDDDLGYPQDLELVKTVDLGVVYALDALWELLGVGPVLKRIVRQKKCRVDYERALFAMTANRLCRPQSKLGVWDTWLPTVFLPSCQDLKLRHMYEAMDLLHEHSLAVEEAVFNQTADLFNLDVDLIFYDTTTASFSIDYEDEDDVEEDPLRLYGKSKEGTWTPQVVVALAVTREGLPVRSWVFPGNTTDVTTVEQIKADLKGWKLGRALFVADSGMNSEDNRKELGRACGKYLLATRMASVSDIKQKVLTRPGRYQKIADNMQAKEVVVGDGEMRTRYILCYNPSEAERQSKHRAAVVERLEQELASHPDRNATAQWAIELQASSRYKRYLAVTKGGKLRIDRQAVKDAVRFDGKWVLETNDDTLSVEAAACGYKSLLIIERCFRSLKRTQIKMTPMYHWLPRRIEAHVKICVLALLLERVAELRCGKPWAHVKGDLDTLQATEFQTKNHHFFRRNEAVRPATKTLQKLGIPLPGRIFGIQ
jgi:hypothetical protein